MAAPNGSGILESVQRGNVEQVAFLIRHDRTLLKEKGWGGFTPLHFAALHGNRPIAELLLDSGADPNIPCDAGQTPFHFACRHGNLSIMHKMLQQGADLRTEDHQGRTALHLAASGGSIVAMHYLWETGMFRFSDADASRITLLHMAASMGNVDVVRYLLRGGRCAVETVDQQGATALHVAAEKGGVEVCWFLLQDGGVDALHMKTHAGHTPLDLSQRGTTFRHQELTKLLSKISRSPNQKPRESYGLYYCTLALPTVSGGVVVLVGAALGKYGGVFCGLLFPWLVKLTMSQYHRLSTYQRLPNPIYLGTLTAGIIHSLICFYVKIIPSIWPAHVLLHVSVLHFFVFLGLFWKVLSQDPGRLHLADSDPKFSSIADLVEANQSSHRFCTHCEIFQVENSKHCRLCELCIRDYDHHCLFLNRCVGRGNHRLFVLFIAAMAIGNLVFLAGAAFFLLIRLPAAGGGWLAAVGGEAWVLLLTAVNALVLAWGVWLFLEQLDAVAMGTTTYFKQFGRRTGARQRRWSAVATFLLEGRRQDPERCAPSVDI